MVGTIYLLKDPVTNQVRYVGQTRQPLTTRLYQHWRDRNQNKEANQHKSNWISKLDREHSLKPIIELIEEFDNISDEDLNLRENFWMDYYWDKECDLTNTSGKFYYRVLKRNHKGNKKTVYAYDRNYNKQVFESAREASCQLKVGYKIISGVACKTKACTNWLFSFTPLTELEVKSYFNQRNIQYRAKIIVIDLKNNTNVLYESQQDAAKKLKIDFRIVSSYLKKQKIYKKQYLFKYAD